MRWDKLAERQIRKAEAEGQFANLKGAGKPLKPEMGDSAVEVWQLRVHPPEEESASPYELVRVVEGEKSRTQVFEGDPADAFQVIRRCGREPGFDHIHAQPGERPGKLQFFCRSEASAGGLLAIPQRGVKNDDALVIVFHGICSSSEYTVACWSPSHGDQPVFATRGLPIRGRPGFRRGRGAWAAEIDRCGSLRR